MIQIASVVIEYSDDRLDKTFDYLYEGNDDIKGKRVNVLFNHREVVGYVLDTSFSSLTKEELEEEYGFKLNYISKVIDQESLINNELLEVAKYMSYKYVSPFIASLQVMLPKSLKPKSVKSSNIKYALGYKYVKDEEGLTSLQKDVLIKIKEKDIILNKELECSKSVIDNLMKKGCIEKVNIEEYRTVNISNNPEYLKEYKMSKEQEECYNNIINCNDICYLLEGVTGSGKSEVYFNLAKYYYSLGKSVIILVPEIILTSQIAARFKGYFKDELALLHSSLTSGEKYDEYRRIKKGLVKIVIGTRSAIFAPLDNLGLIIIDEEHSESYKQESTPCYDTLDIASFRAKFNDAKIVLGSATPSLESKVRAMKGNYRQLYLSKRINNKKLPEVKIVDMNKENNNLFSKELIELIHDRLNKKEQVIILINRRGYAPYLRCKKCGYIFKCGNCDVSMNYHKSDNKIKCHYCGKEEILDACPSCNSRFIDKTGVGSQRIEELVKELFSDARVLRMDLDTTKNKDSHLKYVEMIRNNEIDIIVGTQMVAKGLDFPQVTLVAVLNIDSSLNSSDYRAKEKAYQLLVQVLGRAGRSDKEGIALIQTYKPDDEVLIEASTYDYKSFYNRELSYRKRLDYPPFRTIAYLLFSGKNYSSLYKFAKETKTYLENLNEKEFEVLGPSVPYIAKLNDTYRIKLMCKYRDNKKAIEIFKELKERNLKNSQIKISVIVNPSNDI